MIWYGENRSKRETRWKVGDIVRYDYGPSALMRVERVREMGNDHRGISCSVRYYGRQFFGGVMGCYHGQILGDAKPEEINEFKKERNVRDVERNLYAGLTYDKWLATSPRSKCRK